MSFDPYAPPWLQDEIKYIPCTKCKSTGYVLNKKCFICKGIGEIQEDIDEEQKEQDNINDKEDALRERHNFSRN